MSQFGSKINANTSPSLVGDQGNLPESIFGRETREKMGEEGGKGEAKELKSDFVKMYSSDELGEKLRRLRPEAAEKGAKDWFLLEELNLRPSKLRELEEKEEESWVDGVLFSDLKRSLTGLMDAEASKKRIYFDPDHVSSAEKMKLELKKVRDEFKMSELDCRSASVQIAQLTTKIKHLSSVLRKKDKRSQEELNEMVQRRKKLLRYLRLTDWDTYCFVLSKL